MTLEMWTDLMWEMWLAKWWIDFLNKLLIQKRTTIRKKKNLIVYQKLFTGLNQSIFRVLSFNLPELFETFSTESNYPDKIARTPWIFVSNPAVFRFIITSLLFWSKLSTILSFFAWSTSTDKIFEKNSSLHVE